MIWEAFMIMLLSCFSYTMNEYKIKSQFCHLQLFLQYPQDRTQHYNQSFQHQIFKMIYAKIRSLYICSYLQFVDPFIHLGLLKQQLHFPPHITLHTLSELTNILYFLALVILTLVLIGWHNHRRKLTIIIYLLLADTLSISPLIGSAS